MFSLFRKKKKPTSVRMPRFDAALRPDEPFFAIGDVHGCHTELEILLQKIGDVGPETLCICVGDYVDRGENSAGVLRTVMERNRASPERFKCLAGNHEAMMLSFLEDPDSLPNGERQFKRKCSICHTLTEGSARKAGPSLHNLFGRRAGTVADYKYSETLEVSDIVWSADTINALFDIGPDHYIPGSKMPMQRIVKQQDRDDLIDYLRRATAEGNE